MTAPATAGPCPDEANLVDGAFLPADGGDGSAKHGPFKPLLVSVLPELAIASHCSAVLPGLDSRPGTPHA
jgi:hypothetical protein